MRVVWLAAFTAGLLLVQAVGAEELLLRQEAQLQAGSASSADSTTWFSVHAAGGRRLVVRAASVDFTPAIVVQSGTADPVVREGRAGSAAASLQVDRPAEVRVGVRAAEAGSTAGGPLSTEPLRFSIRIALADPESPLSVGQDRTGTLAYDDETSDGGRYIDRYPLPLNAGRRIAVVMAGEGDLDSYLRIALPDGREVENDDSIGGQAVVRLNPAADGTAEVFATSYAEGETGKYTISVLPLRTPEAVTVGSSRDASLADDDEMIAGQPSDSYLLTGNAGTRVVIRAESDDLDPVLLVQAPDGTTDENDDISDDNLNAELSYTFQSDGELEIVVYSVEASDRGAYTLTVAEGAVPTAISPGSSVEGSLEATDEQVDGRFSDRYVLTGQAGQSVTFTLNSESFDAYLVLIDPDGNPAENDDLSEETTDAELTYLFDRDGSVELQVTSYDSGESGPYILTVSE